jgi:hypothetical protein
MSEIIFEMADEIILNYQDGDSIICGITPAVPGDIHNIYGQTMRFKSTNFSVSVNAINAEYHSNVDIQQSGITNLCSPANIWIWSVVDHEHYPGIIIITSFGQN